MRKVIVGVLAVVGVLSILAVMVLAGFGILSALAKPGVPSKVVLEVNLEGGVLEGIPDDPLAQLMLDDRLVIRDVVDALDRAAGDRRVKALIATIGGGGMGAAHIQEIRDAVERFRASGKPAIAFAETFGEFSSGNGGYYLATAFDEIYLQPSGDVGLTGLMYESTFLRGMYDKLDIVPSIDQRYEFKNAANSYTETEYTPAHREALQTLMNSQFDQIVRGIAAGRELTPEVVRDLVDRGPFLAQEALEAGLVDGLAYRDEVRQTIKEQAGERSRFLFLSAYLSRAGRPNTRGTTVALVHGFGAVTRGRSSFSPIDGSVTMGSASVASALRAAIDDDRVKAIIFRVDSPGGSYVASDTIWRETVRAREAKKPLIVSMGNLAGSGGYFVAMDADRIVAQPGTITASIGVFGGKLVTSGLWNKLGITFDDVRTSAHSSIYSSTHEYNEGEYERLQDGLDRIYEDFTGKVAAGRELPLDEVLELARGRIYTGETALELGLVDELGGLYTSVRIARELLELDDDADVRLKRFPRRRSTWDLVFGQEPENSERAAIRALAEAFRTLQPTARLLYRLAGSGDPGALAMPEWGQVGTVGD